jgi:hypothetical protein
MPTVATIDFAKQFKGHGWVGIRYQIDLMKTITKSSFIFDLKKLMRLQQETLGILGVNLIYGAYYKYNDPKRLLRYLYDHLDKDQLEIDTIIFWPTFRRGRQSFDEFAISKNGMTDAVMFDPTGKIFFPQQYYTKFSP